MESGAAEVQMAIRKQEKRMSRWMARKEKKVVVRAYLPGHEDCHRHRKLSDDVQTFVWNWYNLGNA